MEAVVDRILEHGGVVKAAIERQIEGLRNEAQQSAAGFRKRLRRDREADRRRGRQPAPPGPADDGR